MDKISFIKKNILSFIEYKGFTKYEFYKKTGISNGILSQNNGLSEENILKILNKFPELSERFLLTGEGEMLKPDISQDFCVTENQVQYGSSHEQTIEKLLDRLERQAEEIGRLKTLLNEPNKTEATEK
ncbi:MAG: hypothetical protein Q8861_07160 [Bacteroidota bacterium]|nr:hypothetical protein [Bacteroidota bacterium]